MELTCQKCGSQNMSKQNPFGFAVCGSCGAVSTQIIKPKTLWETTTFGLKWLALSFLVLFFAIMTIQLFIWKDYGFEATYFRIKQLAGVSTLQDRIAVGAICNTLQRFECSVKEFTQVVEEDPNNKKALANLAIAYSMQGLWKSARPHYEAYFSLGGDSYDALYWYGKTVEALNGSEKSIPWFYYALAINNKSVNGVRSLYSSLLEMGSVVEALSLIGSFTRGRPYTSVDWQEKLLKTEFKIVDGETVRLPSLDGRFHFLPLKLSEKGRPHFFRISEKSQVTIIDEDLIFEDLIPRPKVIEYESLRTREGLIDGYYVVVPKVFIGDYLLQNINAFVCSGCHSSLSTRDMKGFSVSGEIKYQIPFLKLKKGS